MPPDQRPLLQHCNELETLAAQPFGGRILAGSCLLSQGGFEFKAPGSVPLLLASANEMLRLIKYPDPGGRFKGCTWTGSRRFGCFLESREKGTPRAACPEQKMELPPDDTRKELDGQFQPYNTPRDTS